MNFLCDKDEFINGLNTVAKALSSKPSIPVFEGIYMECYDNKVKLIASNGQLTIETFVSADTKVEGRVLVPGRLFIEIVKKCYDGDIECLVEEPTTINIFSGKSKAKISTLDVTYFPIIDTKEEEWKVTLNNRVLKDMVRGSIFAAAGENASKPILTGLYCTCEDGSLSFVTIDGYRMAIKNTSVTASNGNVIVPSKAMDEIAKTISDDDEEETTLYVNEKYLKAVNDKTTIISTLINGEYVKYKDILPEKSEVKIKVRRNDLASAIERASIVSRVKKDNLLVLNIDKDSLSITAKSECGDIYDEIDIWQEGGPLRIGFNCNYLNDAFKNINDEYVYMEFNSEISPCVIKPCEGNGFTYLVLPVRISNN